MRLVLRRPAVDQQAEGHEDGAGDHHGHAELGPPDGVRRTTLEGRVDTVLQWGAYLCAEEETQPEGDIVQPPFADTHAIPLGQGTGPERGEGREDDVHQTVEVHHI